MIYVNKLDAEQLLNSLQDHYKVEIDWTGGLCCGITLDWNYKDRYVDISMPGYTKKQLQKHEHTQTGSPKIVHKQPQSRSMEKPP